VLAACQLGSLVAVKVGVAQVFQAMKVTGEALSSSRRWAAMVSSRMLCPIGNPTKSLDRARQPAACATATLPAVAESVE